MVRTVNWAQTEPRSATSGIRDLTPLHPSRQLESRPPDHGSHEACRVSTCPDFSSARGEITKYFPTIFRSSPLRDDHIGSYQTFFGHCILHCTAEWRNWREKKHVVLSQIIVLSALTQPDCCRNRSGTWSDEPAVSSVHQQIPHCHLSNRQIKYTDISAELFWPSAGAELSWG